MVLKINTKPKMKMDLPKLMHHTEFDGNPRDSLGVDSRHCITNMQ
jgi:hypothetical protein